MSVSKLELKKLKAHCKKCVMQGQGFMDVMSSIGKHFVTAAKALGPTVLKSIILPMIKKKIESSGNGLRLAGPSKKKSKTSGHGLVPSGNGVPKRKPARMVKGSQQAKDYMKLLRSMRKKK